jgi:hypothetical protein
MRRLDQHELEASFCRNGGLHHEHLRRLIRSCQCSASGRT